jgi:transcriptional regulator with XRE-family HTH domain
MLTLEQLMKEIKEGCIGYKQAYISEKSGVDTAIISRLLAGKIAKPEYCTLWALHNFIVSEAHKRTMNSHVINLRGE